MQTFIDFFGIKNFIPHGFCLSWNPVLLWLHVASDLLITLSYYSIPLSLAYFIRKRKDFPYAWLILMFGLFIVACGTTHLMSAVLIWIPLYWLDGYLKVFTAIISVATAIAMLRIIPLALQLPTVAQLQVEINNRKKVEAELLVANTRFHALFENMRNGVAVYEAIDNGNDFIFRDFNRAAEVMDCITREELLNKPVTEVFPSVEQFGLLAVMRRVWQTGEPENLPAALYQDERLSAYLENYVYRLPSGEVVAVIEDVTERKKAELARQEASERLYKIANQLPSVVFQFQMRADGSFCIPYANELLRDVYHLSPEDVREDASAIFAVTHPDDLASHIEKIKTSARELSPWSDQYRLKFEDGTERWLWGNALPQREADGSTLWHGFVMDISKQKQVEIAFQKESDKNLALLRNASDGIHILNHDGNVVECSDAFCTMLGYSREELIGRHVSQWDVEIPENEIMNVVHAQFEKTMCSQFESRHRRKDGTIYDVELSGCPIEFDGEWVLFNSARDITERKRMEDRLKASERRLNEIINLMPIAVFIKDTESCVTMMNSVCESQWGIRISELQNTTGSHIFPPEQMEIFLAADKKVFVDGKTFEIEELIWNAELQANRIIHTYKKPVFNERGEPDYLIGISVDVTEAKQQEQALKESEERLILSQEYGEIGSWEADLINNTQIWSATAYQILGLPIDKNTQTWEKFLDLVHVDDKQKVVDATYTHLAQKEKYDVEYRAITATGEIRWLRSAGRAQFLDDGTPFKFIGIVQDVTEHHTLEVELKRSNADLEQFAYAVSHDMRQPLRMVTSYLSLIEIALETHLNEDTRQFLTFAVDGAKRMDSMILSLLDYSRVGRRTEALTVISSRAAVDEALLFLKPALETSGGTVEVLGDWIDLVASRDELTRLLQNLIGNALKYHEENKPPHVKVLAIVTKNTFRLEVRDSGIGIDPGKIDRLFKVFSRLQARSRFEGTGVGLALCRKIVEYHGGTIGVKSKGEGQGCIFWFELPRKPIEG